MSSAGVWTVLECADVSFLEELVVDAGELCPDLFGLEIAENAGASCTPVTGREHGIVQVHADRIGEGDCIAYGDKRPCDRVLHGIDTTRHWRRHDRQPHRSGL